MFAHNLLCNGTYYNKLILYTPIKDIPNILRTPLNKGHFPGSPNAHCTMLSCNTFLTS